MQRRPTWMNRHIISAVEFVVTDADDHNPILATDIDILAIGMIAFLNHFDCKALSAC